MFFSSVVVLSQLFGINVSAAPMSRLIIAKVPFETYGTDKIYITGNTDTLCNWVPNCIQMSSIGNGVFQASITMPEDLESLEFKVTRGTWDSEATNQYNVTFENAFIHATDPDQPTVLQILGWKDRAIPTKASPLLEIIPNFYSPQLNNVRSLRVLLPLSYSISQYKTYPVIYMHDGQNLFDSATSNYGVEWNVDETYTSLVKAGKIREAIIVGLDANDDRLNEYDYTIKGQAYASFLIDTVKPYIDKNFRTMADRENTYLSGSSMGAHISFSLIWHHPEIFSKAAGLSLPAFIHDNSLYEIITADTKPVLRVDAYMDHGDFNNDSTYPAADDAFMNYLQHTVGFQMDQMTYKNFPYADHFEGDWSRRFAIPLQFLLAPL